jgi:Flp pilus assembly protein TadG
MTSRASFLADRTASAAAEMALVLPILLVLMFGSVELGNYFLSEHVVQKAVRDASRYAARLPVTNFDCASGAMTDATPVQKLARTGDPTGTTARLVDWTADSMTTVTVACDTSGTYTGIYRDFPMGVPVVTVTASVPYTSLFGTMGLGGTLSLNATQQAAVIGA